MGNTNSVVQKLAKKDLGKEHFSCLVILHFVYYLIIIRFSNFCIFYWHKITVFLIIENACVYLNYNTYGL